MKAAPTTEIPIIPDNAPFLPEQRVWLNGFLAGYFARLAVPAGRTEPAEATQALVALRILYGSQTGTAQGLAKRIAKEARSRGFVPRVTDAAEYKAIDWSKETTMLVITSTYGEGDMPDNAQPFWEWLQTDAAAGMMAHLRFSVLALGDRNYTEFCAAGRKIDTRLEEMGARRLFGRVDCDVEYETTANEWMDGALKAASGTGSVLNVNVAAVLKEVATAETKTFSKSNPFLAELRRNICLNKPGSAKEVRHFELDLNGSGLTYNAGDALGVLPLNCPALVADILRAVHCTGEEAVTVGGIDLPLREALTSRLDITKPSAEFLTEIGRREPGSELAGLLGPEKAGDLKKWLWGRHIIDLLGLLRAPLPCQDLAALLRKLCPRLYSISSSPKAHPGQVHLTVSALRYQSHGRERKGVASTFLADRVGEPGRAKIFVQPSHGFKLPAADDVPVIMIGPGTGIAPFRGFLEERQSIGAKGRNWLFFGEQKRATDFLYEEELSEWLKSGHLDRLDVAFSRDQVEKVYVQDRMFEQSAAVWAWLQEGAHFYVCGDALRMAKDVDAALHRIAETEGGLGPEGAVEFVQRLKKEKRYQRDVY